MPLIRDARRLALYRLVLPFGVALLALLPGTDAIAQPQTLSLSDVLARTIDYDPTARAGAAHIRAAEASLDQADTRPNPVLGIEMEDFAGSGNYSRFDETSTTLYYEELWERGGKRKARTDIAGAELALAEKRRTANLLDLAAEVQAAWIDAIAAQVAAALADDRLSAVKQMEREFQRRANRALDPQFAHERVLAMLSQAQIDSEQAALSAQTTRATLASYWGGDGNFRLDEAEFTRLAMNGELDDDPTDLALLTAARETAAARVRFEKANSVQDVSLRAGLRHFSADDDVAVVFGVSIPLGVYDTNRSSIERAQAEQLAAEIDIAAARNRRQREIARLIAAQSAGAVEIRRLDAEILPRLERALALVREGFNRGGTAFTLLDVTESQRALTGAYSRRIDLLRRFHLDGMRLDRLSDRHVSLLSNVEHKQ
ncbi:MAG: TolC family protein [Parvibaculum sp.]|uniref:TolC family protein n=1 Tax=Parvibaculum sp. TaxID=2024848 RepID=UPI0032ED05B2